MALERSIVAGTTDLIEHIVLRFTSRTSDARDDCGVARVALGFPFFLHMQTLSLLEKRN